MTLANSRPAHTLRSAALDAADWLAGRRDPLVPPRRMVFVGAGDYRAVGDEFFAHFKAAGLRPEHDVLDVGCGIGRMALPLVGWLRGSYNGFDIVQRGIGWCQRNITPRAPNFTFTHADVRNPKYNPEGREGAETFRFPYADRSFDFAWLTSVFTHITPPGVLHYLEELRRVVRPGGTVVATYFLLDDASRAGVVAGRSTFSFQYPHASTTLGEFLTIHPDSVESAIAYDRQQIIGAHEQRALPVQEVWPGTWSGNERGVSLQDITISRCDVVLDRRQNVARAGDPEA